MIAYKEVKMGGYTSIEALFIILIYSYTYFYIRIFNMIFKNNYIRRKFRRWFRFTVFIVYMEICKLHFDYIFNKYGYLPFGHCEYFTIAIVSIIQYHVANAFVDYFFEERNKFSSFLAILVLLFNFSIISFLVAKWFKFFVRIAS